MSPGGAAAPFKSLLRLCRVDLPVGVMRCQSALGPTCRDVNRGGLPLLYEILLDSAASQLCTVLRIVTRSAERGQTSLFFCKLGAPRECTAAFFLPESRSLHTGRVLEEFSKSAVVAHSRAAAAEREKSSCSDST